MSARLLRPEDVIARAPVALLCIRGSDRVVELANDALLELLGERDWQGRRADDAFPELGLSSLLDQASPESATRRVRVGRIDAGGEGDERFVDVTVRSLGADGAVESTIVVASDVTERALAERSLGLRADIGDALTGAGTLQERLQRCTEELVEHLEVAFARIWTLDETEDVLVLQASAGLYTHLDGPHGRVPVGQFKIGLIAEERRPHLTNAVVGDPRVGDQDWARREGMQAFAGYPLLMQDRLVGVMGMFSRERLAASVLDALASVADEIAIGIDQGRQQERRDRIARTLQQSLLTSTLPDVPGLEVASLFRPAGDGTEVGGDFYDVFHNDDGTWSVVVGDVCGKGVEAAALTSLARYTIRAVSGAQAPGRVLAGLNRQLARQEDGLRFCTVACTRWHVTDGGAAVDLAIGGHPLPFVVRADGTIERAGTPGLIVGPFPDAHFPSDTLALGAGDALVLFTDGLVELPGADPAHVEERIAEVLSAAAAGPAAELVDRLAAAILPTPQRDDVAIVAVRVRPGGPPAGGATL